MDGGFRGAYVCGLAGDSAGEGGPCQPEGSLDRGRSRGGRRPLPLVPPRPAGLRMDPPYWSPRRGGGAVHAVDGSRPPADRRDSGWSRRPQAGRSAAVPPDIRPFRLPASAPENEPPDLVGPRRAKSLSLPAAPRAIERRPQCDREPSREVDRPGSVRSPQPDDDGEPSAERATSQGPLAETRAAVS